MTGPEDEGLSFIFIVNHLAANEDPSAGGILPRDVEGRWVPPVFARGFYCQEAGRVYRWNNGQVSRLDNYTWRHGHIDAEGGNEAANGTVLDPNRYPLTHYRAATVFYANPFIKFRTTPGDASARDLHQNGEIWHHLRFHHVGPNISLVDHAGTEDYLAGRSSACPWHKQLIPQAYECHQTQIQERRFLHAAFPLSISRNFHIYNFAIQLERNLLARFS